MIRHEMQGLFTADLLVNNHFLSYNKSLLNSLKIATAKQKKGCIIPFIITNKKDSNG
jgi:hypothetical protein